DRFYYHPLPAKASATEGNGFEGSIVGATKVFTRADDSCIPFRRGSSLQHYVTVIPSIIPSRSASSHRCSDPASGNCPVSGKRNLCDPSRSMGCHSESRVNNSEGTHAGCRRGSWNSLAGSPLLVVPMVFLLGGARAPSYVAYSLLSNMREGKSRAGQFGFYLTFEQLGLVVGSFIGGFLYASNHTSVLITTSVLFVLLAALAGF